MILRVKQTLLLGLHSCYQTPGNYTRKTEKISYFRKNMKKTLDAFKNDERQIKSCTSVYFVEETFRKITWLKFLFTVHHYSPYLYDSPYRRIWLKDYFANYPIFQCNKYKWLYYIKIKFTYICIIFPHNPHLLHHVLCFIFEEFSSNLNQLISSFFVWCFIAKL